MPENVVIVIARADDTTFGLLHSRFHGLWSLRMCTWMGKGNDPRYTPTTCFETSPFPATHEALDAAVAAAYGWADDTAAMPDEEILRRLLAPNRERSAAEVLAVPHWKSLAQASEQWRGGAVAKVTTRGAEHLFRPAAFVFADKEGVQWVEPSYADPHGASSPALHRCEGPWLAWNRVQGADWTVELVPCDPREPSHAGARAALDWHTRWLAQQSRSWQAERKAVWKKIKPVKA
ncbi:MAG: hypothetical protein JNJ89_05345 [Rubrivivax sp.]|nr:hypothetical protein [Rubrivivax sp.]